jgi:hypothetical protein
MYYKNYLQGRSTKQEELSVCSVRYYTAVDGGGITCTAQHSLLVCYGCVCVYIHTQTLQGLFSMAGFNLLVKPAKSKSLG